METLMKAEELAPAIKWHPFDYLREYDPFKLKRAYAERVCQPIDPDFDLSGLTDDGAFYCAEKLVWDSAFWGFGVGKVRGIWRLPGHDALERPDDYAYMGAINHLEIAALSAGVRYLHIEVADEDTILKLSLQESGWKLVETIHTVHRHLTNYQHPRGERWAVRDATEDDLPALTELSAKVFDPYDRFHADDTLNQDKVAQLMARWPRASLDGTMATKMIVPDVPGRPHAWMSARHEDWSAVGAKISRPGYAVIAPAMTGWYSKLLSEICYYLRVVGSDHIYIPGSASNRAVIKAWHNLGFVYGHTTHIFRVRL
jgi:hypothetical protein